MAKKCWDLAIIIALYGNLKYRSEMVSARQKLKLKRLTKTVYMYSDFSNASDGAGHARSMRRDDTMVDYRGSNKGSCSIFP